MNKPWNQPWTMVKEGVSMAKNPPRQRAPWITVTHRDGAWIESPETHTRIGAPAFHNWSTVPTVSVIGTTVVRGAYRKWWNP